MTQAEDNRFSLIKFDKVLVPVGFLGSFRKKNHHDCESGQGYVTAHVEGGKRQLLCGCATNRAIKRYRQIGASAFATQGSEWLKQNQSKPEA